MQFVFDSPDPTAAHLRQFAEHRVRFVMRRHAWLLSFARLRLTDMNGPRGGPDKCCRLALKTERDGTLHVTSVAADWRAALEGALARASALLVRRRSRSRAQRRQLPQHTAETPREDALNS